MSSVLAAPEAVSAMRGEKLCVMVVDDSAVIRGLISRWVAAEPDMNVVASLRTGREAVDHLVRVNPAVVVLDIEMPDLDGISALPLLLARKRDLVVIMASTLTRRNAEISFKALSLGASDYIPKPEGARDKALVETFRQELIRKIRYLGMRRRAGAPAVQSPPLAPAASDAAMRAAVTPVRSPAKPRLALRPLSSVPPRVLTIGSSTGGPQALMTLMAEIAPVIERCPVLIAQHMPPTFTTILAEHLARVSKRPAHEGVDGEPVKPGHIYVAPGGKHMRVARQGTETVIALDDGPQINFCKPAVDPLFQSVASVWQSAVMAVVLTGMGADGMRGGKDVVAAGGSVIAQDEATSVVWGMPGAAAQAGICAAVLPLGQIGPKLVRVFSGDRS